MDKITYSERKFIINLVISSCDSLNPFLVSQKIKIYFNIDVSIEEILAYTKEFKILESEKFTLKMSDIF